MANNSDSSYEEMAGTDDSFAYDGSDVDSSYGSEPLSISSISFQERAFIIFARLMISTLMLAMWSSVMLSLATVVYFSLVHQYLPPKEHEYPVSFVFSFDPRTGKRLSNLKGRVTFDVKGITADKILANDQPYTISLKLVMPQSPVNEKESMFMTCLRIHSASGKTVKQTNQRVNNVAFSSEQTGTCKSAIINYKSDVRKILESLMNLPRMALGYGPMEMQEVVILFDNHFQDDRNDPAFGAEVEIQSRSIEISSAELSLVTEYFGLRYLIEMHPLFTAIVGILLNYIVIGGLLSCLFLRF